MIDIDEMLGRLGMTELNDMQRDTYAAVTGTDGDVVVVSPTGSGKTLAYMIPLAEMLDAAADRLQAVVVVPNRELAQQSAAVMESMKTGLRSMCCYGGRPAMDEHRAMRQVRPQVVFGTPGRLNDHFAKGNLSPYGVRYVVIDEFDKCLEMGFHAEMSRLIDRLVGVRRRILLSATDAVEIPDFVTMSHTSKLDYTADALFARVDLHTVSSPERDKLGALGSLLCSLGDESSMVFLNYRDSVERVAAYLAERGFGVSAFHGGMDQPAREAALYRFSNGSANILVSTDLASRGLDIPDVDNIVHYHMPQTAESYVHRTGRTARWDKRGRAFLLLSPDESVPDFIAHEHSEWPLDEPLPAPKPPRMATIYIGKGKRDKVSKGDIVGFLCKKGGLTTHDIGRIDVKERYAYVAIARQRVESVLSLVQGEKIKGIKTVVELVR